MTTKMSKIPHSCRFSLELASRETESLVSVVVFDDFAAVRRSSTSSTASKEKAMGNRGTTFPGSPMTSTSWVCVGRCALVSKYVRVMCLLPLLCLCCVMPVLSNDNGSGLRDVTLDPGLGTIPLVPVFGTLGPLKTLGLWQLPKGPVRKLLVIFKPMQTLPHVFWDRSPSCLECSGHPEKRKFVVDALARNYAVLVPESLVGAYGSTGYGNWGAWPEDNSDILNVAAMISDWKSLHGLENVPTVGMGSSAGGFIMSTLALRPGFFESIALIVSSGQPEAIELANHEYPPVIFVHMPKNLEMVLLIDKTRRMFASQGIPSAEARWYEHPLTPDWYTHFIPGVNLALSMEIISLIRGEGWLDESNILTWPTIFYDWRKTSARWNLASTDESAKRMLLDALFEETEIAYARHATVARKNDKVFEWFEGAYNAQEKALSSS